MIGRIVAALLGAALVFALGLYFGGGCHEQRKSLWSTYASSGERFRGEAVRFVDADGGFADSAIPMDIGAATRIAPGLIPANDRFDRYVQMLMASPIVMALVAYLISAFRLRKAQADRERANLEAEQAKRSVNLAKEARAASNGRITGPEAAVIAEADFRQRVKGATSESAQAAVRAAVGEMPDVGASSKPRPTNGANGPIVIPGSEIKS